MPSYISNAAQLRDEHELRTQRAHELGASDARHLRLVADELDGDGAFLLEGGDDAFLLALPGVDAERLRLLARELEMAAMASESDESDISGAWDGDALDPRDAEIESLRQHADTLHRAFCDALDDLDRAEQPVFVFVLASTPFCPAGLSPALFSDLAVFLLDEIE